MRSAEPPVTPLRAWTNFVIRADRAAAYLEGKWFLYLLLLLLLYVLTTWFHAHRRMWYDELLTFYIAQMPSISEGWATIKEGADFNPPLLYLATRFFQSMFGNSEAVTRLPALLGFLVMLLCIFQFVSRYGSRLAALAATTFPLGSGAYYYSHEARPYGLVLGFTGVAAVCWQLASRDERRNVAIPGLALALASALSSHCYAVLILIPFALGETARIVGRRRADWPMLTALAVPCFVVLSYIPLVASLRGQPLNNAVYHASILDSYLMIFSHAFVPLFVVWAVVLFGSLRAQPDNKADRLKPPMPELVLGIALSLTPVFGFLLAASVTNIFMDRYGLPAILGASILLGAFISTRTRGNRPVALVAILILAANFLVDPALASGFGAARQQAHSNNFNLPELKPDIPIVIDDPLLFLEFDHYEPTEVTQRIYFVTDRTWALKYTGTTVLDRYYESRKRLPIRSHLERYDRFLLDHRHFFILTRPYFPLDWVARKMSDDALPLTVIGQYPLQHGDTTLMEVSLPPQ